MSETSRCPPTVPPSVAVVIPYYNGARFIERALDSVFAQSEPAREVVVVNDGSRPDERQFLHGLTARYPFKLIDQDNGGQGSARNAGVAASTSDFICFLDQDDFYLEHHIRILARAIPSDEPRFGYVYGDLAEADGDGRIIRASMVKEHSAHPKQSIFDMLRNDIFVLPSAALISRRAFEAVGGFDTQFMGFEDDDLFLRIFREGYTNHFVDKVVTVWCIHTGSTSFDVRMIRSRFKYFRKLVGMFPDEPRRNRFYLRDHLMPRFGRYFVDHVIEATKAGDESRVEMSGILAEYASIVNANPSVGRLAKAKLNATVFMVQHSPPSLIRTIGAITKLPGLRALRRMLG
ncbi:glycosyltransferase family A protein [Variovorax sp. J31P207]|uniref:glycosyltransferase family 2 protein n=1 Tax=Variovorax sp. J31P207 TaxID=3053510 RepID=UPI0025768F14|nr:glycosyltransferase family A protein [Variovorax sp. J31P207]MDM0067688.1 glycosyltransferase family A protein [Variovorax sp. J31P207]